MTRSKSCNLTRCIHSYFIQGACTKFTNYITGYSLVDFPAEDNTIILLLMAKILRNM